MVRAVGENTFQLKIGFKTRYGMVSKPFVGDNANGLVQMEVVVLQKSSNQQHSVIESIDSN